ncbi:MAG: hypothetical protein HY717_08955 [Planctomycetes bacterium]|nr:hypothetical protein [Planctomycetota bacterium]
MATPPAAFSKPVVVVGQILDPAQRTAAYQALGIPSNDKSPQTAIVAFDLTVAISQLGRNPSVFKIIDDGIPEAGPVCESAGPLTGIDVDAVAAKDAGGATIYAQNTLAWAFGPEITPVPGCLSDCLDRNFPGLAGDNPGKGFPGTVLGPPDAIDPDCSGVILNKMPSGFTSLGRGGVLVLLMASGIADSNLVRYIDPVDKKEKGYDLFLFDAGGAGDAAFFEIDIADCNANQIDDAADIARGTSLDCNQNAIPDECEVRSCPEETFQGIDGVKVSFPGGRCSFLDAVIDYAPNFATAACPSPPLPNINSPEAALGPPDFALNPGDITKSAGAVSLGIGGGAKFAFTDNLLINSGDDQIDLVIFEASLDPASAEPLMVSVRADEETRDLICARLNLSCEGNEFIEIGKTSGGTGGVDLDKFFLDRFGQSFKAGELRFDAVGLLDDGGLCNATPGADIDAVGAIFSIPKSKDCNANGIPDECDIKSGASKDENSNGIPDECGDGGATVSFEQCQANVIDVILKNRIHVKAGEFAIGCDPLIIIPVAVEKGPDFPLGDGDVFFDLNPPGNCPLVGLKGLTFGWFNSKTKLVLLAPGEHRILRIAFKQAGPLPAGNCTPLKFLTCLGPAVAPVRNIVTNQNNQSVLAMTVDGKFCSNWSCFRRGDANEDGQFDVSDVIEILGCLFLSDLPCPGCFDAMDANDTGELDISDAVYLIFWRFKAGPQPPAPFPSCGSDLTPDLLPACVYPGDHCASP